MVQAPPLGLLRHVAAGSWPGWAHARIIAADDAGLIGAAGIRLLVLDACRSGAITRVKGATAGPPLAARVRAPGQGVVFLTASAASEDANFSRARALLGPAPFAPEKVVKREDPRTGRHIHRQAG